METAKSKAYVGVTGFGKSWAMGADIEKWFQNDFFPVIIDKKRDHTGLGKYLGFRSVKCGKKSIQNLDSSDWKKIIKQTNEDYSGLMIQPYDADPEINPEDLTELANKVAYAILSTNLPRKDGIYYGIEEIRNFAPSQSDKKKFNAITTCVVEGRSKDVVFGCTLQFPQQVHWAIIQAFPITYVFGLGENDNKYSKFGIDGKLRSEMKDWSKDERKCLVIDTNSGNKEVISTKDWSRSTPHSG